MLFYSVGMKPTFGLVPYSGALGGVSCVDHLGPMVRNVKDCALLLEVKHVDPTLVQCVYGYCAWYNTHKKW